MVPHPGPLVCRQPQRTARPDVSPSKVRGYLHPAAGSSPSHGALSWSSLLFRVLYVPTYRACWVGPIPDPCLVVSDGPRWSSGGTGPPLLAQRGSSSRELRSPSESLRAVTCPCARAPGRLPWGFLPLHDVSCRVHMPTDIPGPSSFRPRRFARPRRVPPLLASRVCFASLPCPGFSLQGIVLPTSSYRLVAGRSPLAVGAAACRFPGASKRRVDLRGLLLIVIRRVRGAV